MSRNIGAERLADTLDALEVAAHFGRKLPKRSSIAHIRAQLTEVISALDDGNADSAAAKIGKSLARKA